MTADVSLSTVAPRPTAVVSQTTTWQQFPSAWKPLLDEVYGFVSGREADLAPHGGPEVWRNAFLYLGHWREDAGELETEIYYLVQRPATAAITRLHARVPNS